MVDIMNFDMLRLLMWDLSDIGKLKKMLGRDMITRDFGIIEDEYVLYQMMFGPEFLLFWEDGSDLFMRSGGALLEFPITDNNKKVVILDDVTDEKENFASTSLPKLFRTEHMSSQAKALKTEISKSFKLSKDLQWLSSNSDIVETARIRNDMEQLLDISKVYETSEMMYLDSLVKSFWTKDNGFKVVKWGGLTKQVSKATDIFKTVIEMAEGIELKMFMGPVQEMLVDTVLTVTKAEAMFQEGYNSNEIKKAYSSEFMRYRNIIVKSGERFVTEKMIIKALVKPALRTSLLQNAMREEFRKMFKVSNKKNLLHHVIKELKLKKKSVFRMIKSFYTAKCVRINLKVAIGEKVGNQIVNNLLAVKSWKDGSEHVYVYKTAKVYLDARFEDVLYLHIHIFSTKMQTYIYIYLYIYICCLYIIHSFDPKKNYK